MRMILGILPILAAGYRLDFEADKNRPVSRVVNLLKEMQKTLEKEQKEDEEIYEKMACWCTANDKEKTQSIKDAESTISQLTSKIESLTAQSGRLSTEINDLNKEIAEHTQALDKATALRSKQLEEFNIAEKDLVQAITSLKSAIIVLSKHHSLMQEEGLLGIAVMLKKHLKRTDLVITPSQKKKIRTFIQSPSYSSQSGEIFGILKNMNETFQNNLEASRREEAESAKAFIALKTAKLAEISAAQEQVDKKSVENANAQEANAQAKKGVEDTRNSLSADEQFLQMLKEKCALTNEEWTQRQKTRQEEVVAISGAISVLANDDARDNFTKVYNFVQVDEKFTRATVSKMLSLTAQKYHSPQIAQISVKVRLDAFKRVKAAIDEMIAQLGEEKKDEITHKDWCIKNLHENEIAQTKTDRDRQDEEARIDQLQTSIKALTSLINKLATEISDLEVQLKRAGEDREKQNAEFQVVLQDQRDAQDMLNRAKDFLQRFYDQKTKGVGFLQSAALKVAGPPPPQGFGSFKKNEGGNSVILMLQQIIADTKAMEAELIHDEDESQKTYEGFVKETNRSLEAKNDQKVDTAADRAGQEQELSEAQASHAGLLTEAEQLSNHNGDIHKSCDFVLKNFDIRQTSRDEEVEALRQAKQILSGSNFQKFLQQA